MRNRLHALLVLCVVANAWAVDYKIALRGYQYQFPRDHFDHPNYQTEWWYYTGNLKSADGHRFGFELTFFRQGIARDENRSTWHIRDLYMAHLALSDISGHKFYYTERINRGGPGIAGVSEDAGLIWNGNWESQFGKNSEGQRLRGIGENFSIQFELKSAKPPIIHGRDGISQKAEGEGHASHYISFTRLLTAGSVILNDTTYQVQGTSWMDHEFFTESLDSSESGWDWLSLQLNDDTELMLYRLRHKDGSVDPYSSGTYVDARGKSTFLSSKDFEMTPGVGTWTSPQSRGTYPVHWKVEVPALGLEIDVTTPLATQELFSKIGPSYWEGAIDISGRRGSDPVGGVGYLEMTGYSATLGKNSIP